MIDKLQGFAQTIQILRLPSIAVGLISLASMVVIMFISKSPESDRFLIPSIVGLLWAISTYSFIVTFRSVPEKSNISLKFFSKLKRNINRGWYWFIGIVFLGTTVAVMFVTYRLVSIWLRDYGG
jgi:Mn2+/Fe2+ NRAMP family transporter